MKLREKTLVAIVTTFFITFIVLIFISRNIFLKGFIKLEQSEAENQLRRVVNAINMDLSNFNSSNKDYSSWDETYEYVQNKNEKYIKTDLTTDTFRSLKINMLIMMDTSGEVMYTRGYDFRKGQNMPLPKHSNIFTDKNSKILNNINNEEGVSGLVVFDEGIMIIVARPILTSEGNGPRRGVLITGRYLDEEEQKKYEKVVNIHFSLQKNDVNISPKGLVVKDSNGGIVLDVIDNDKIKGYKIIDDIDNKPSILLQIDINRDIYKQGLVSIKYLTILMLTIGIIFTAITLIILEQLIIKKILKLNNCVNRIKDEQNTSIRVKVSGKDELSNLSKGFNLMLDVLESYINKLRSSEEKYKTSNEKLKELDKLKTDFLSTVSHELRTPLTSILGFCKIIKKKINNTIIPNLMAHDEKVSKVSEQILSNIDIIINQSERLTEMINDVLDIEKMEAGKMQWKMEKINICEIIEVSLNVLMPLFEAKQLAVNKEISNAIIYVLGDKDKLVQVVVNLLSNAVKFTETGVITCRVEIINSEVVVSVIDTGIGIADKELNSVFEKFKQVGDTLVNKPKGTGLGLPICKNIIEYHKGEIWVESEINKGSRFSFSLPLL